MEIDFETAMKGGEEKIRINRLDTCSTCAGDGIQPGSEVKTCNHCGGSGAVLHKAKPVGMGPTDNFSGHRQCTPCRGTGQSVAENCGNCHGKGIKKTTKDITLVIPSGVIEGSKLRLKGDGDAGPMGGPSGDLFIFLKIKNQASHGADKP
jgi:molecular chaperone DnaJ